MLNFLCYVKQMEDCLLINKKSFFLAILLGSIFMLIGCGDKKLDSFQDDMTKFKDNVVSISETMDNIDATSDTATDDLLSCLDDMNEQFQFLAAIEVPSKFSNVETLADEASTYMSEAVSLYHEYYESTDYDDSVRQAASENYSRAMKRMSYISVLLQGNIPDDSEVMVTEEDGVDFQPVTTDIDEESEYESVTESVTESEEASTDNENTQNEGPVKVGSKSN